MESVSDPVLQSVYQIVASEVAKEYQLGNFRKPFLFVTLGMGGLYYITDLISQEKKFPGRHFSKNFYFHFFFFFALFHFHISPYALGFQEEPTIEKTVHHKQSTQDHKRFVVDFFMFIFSTFFERTANISLQIIIMTYFNFCSSSGNGWFDYFQSYHQKSLDQRLFFYFYWSPILYFNHLLLFIYYLIFALVFGNV